MVPLQCLNVVKLIFSIQGLTNFSGSFTMAVKSRDQVPVTEDSIAFLRQHFNSVDEFMGHG
jgi:hypothetical protein